MEVVIYGAFTAVWWVSSMSVLLPLVLLLKFSKFFRDRWFSWFFMVVGPLFNHKLTPLRKKVFEFLKEHLPRRDKSEQLEVLEIGIGGGANLEFYPENSNLTALDMNESFEKYFVENQKKYPQVKYARTIIAFAENMKDVEDDSMDLVICTYVLCSVENIQKVLNEVIRVLKPGGKFLFLEHVSFPKSQWENTVQRFVAPLWHLYFDGCIVHRDIAIEINQANFSNVLFENILPSSIYLFVRPQIFGIATK